MSLNEVKNAIFSLGASKAVGPDGIPGSFYQKSWEVICLDLLRFIQLLFHSGSMLNQWNKTNKSPAPESVSDFRPISLMNFSYKFISKIMVNRLKPIVNSIISESQSAFIERRHIQDNIVVAQEAFDFLK